MDVILVGANLSKDPRIPLRDLPTDLCKDGIDLGVTDHAAILGWTDQRIHQDRDMMTLLHILAHTSDDNTLGASEASVGESDPQRLKRTCNSVPTATSSCFTTGWRRCA